MSYVIDVLQKPPGFRSDNGHTVMRNALTFDVEEYFHVEAAAKHVPRRSWSAYPSRVEHSTHCLLDILDVRGVVGTFFVLGVIAERHPTLVRSILSRGHEVACHSHAHRPVYSMRPAEFRDDVRQAKKIIENVIGAPVYGYRAPTFSIVRSCLWALDILVEEGFEYDSSIFPIHHDRYGIPDAPRFPHRVRLAAANDILEFPMTTFPVAGQRLPFCGGGYFRLLPYPLIRAGIRWINQHEGQPAIVYLHPWELDADQPRLPLRGVSRVRHYVNLRSTSRKLERMLDDFEFGTAHDILDMAAATTK